MLADVRKILFIELLGGLGDLVIALPAIHALAHNYPEAAIDILTFLPNGELLEAEPVVGRVFYAVRGRAPEAVKDVLSACHYDLVISDTHRDGIGPLVEECGSKYKIPRLWQSSFPDELVQDIFLRNMISAGIIEGTNNRSRPLLSLSESDRAWAMMWRERNLNDTKRTVFINPHSGMPIKRWDAESFIGLGRALAEVGVGLVVVSGEDPSLARYVARQIGPAATVLPTTTLRQFAALAATADLFMSVDTGPGRIAAAVNTPTAMLFGPTWSGRYGLAEPHVNLQSPFVCPYLNPVNFTEQPCWYSGICVFPEKRNCLDDISPQSTYALAKKMLRI